MTLPRLLLATALTALVAASCAQARPLPRLHAEPDAVHGGRIADSGGREVILRGVNVNAMGEYWQGTAVKPVLPFGEADARRIGAIGWNVVRLIVSWSRVEPSPGRYDDAYLARVRRQIDRLERQGVYTIVDLHQDAWSATLAARPGEACTAPYKPALGWDGAPAWATFDGGKPHCYTGAREVNPAVQHAWDAFFSDHPGPGGVGIQTRYAAMLRHIARGLATRTAVAGIDVMNEPGALSAAQTAALGPFYARALKAIRSGERAGRGFRHLVLFEPGVAWSLIGHGAPPAFPHDSGVVYAPHLYGGSIGGTSAPRRASFVTARSEAQAFGGAPVLTGEWGGDPSRAAPGSDEYFAAHQALQDEFRIGATLWTWKQSCGDPHDVLTQREGAASPTPPWSVFAMDCAGGRNRITGEHHALVADLRRAYVRAAPGRLDATAYAPAARVLTAAGSGAGRHAAPLEAFFPWRRPRVSGRGLGRITMTAVRGGGTLVHARATRADWSVRVGPQ